jgi:ribosomal protein L37E
MKIKPLELDMCASSELKDSQGETLNLEGADISELMTRGRLNDNHGAGSFNSLGRVTYAKKIFKQEDCDNDREKYYWEKVKAPYLYVKGVLYNDEDHPNAKAAAAILRHIHKADASLQLKASVEGGVVQRGLRDPARLERTKIHSVALTFTPANNATLVEPLNLSKSSHIDEEADMALIKSVMHLVKKDEEIPSFRHIERHVQADKIVENLNKIKDLAKSVGIDISIANVDSSDLANKALQNKIVDNIIKIKELTKAMNVRSKLAPVPPQAGAKYNAARTKPGPIIPSTTRDYTPIKANVGEKRHRPSGELVVPGGDLTHPLKTISPAQQQINVKTKSVALKLRQDPSKWKMVKQAIASSPLHPEKKQQLIVNLFKEMQGVDPNLKKGLTGKDMLHGVKSLALAGGLLYGAHEGLKDADKEAASQVNPSQSIEQTQDPMNRVKEIKNQHIRDLVSYYKNNQDQKGAKEFVNWASNHYDLTPAKKQSNKESTQDISTKDQEVKEPKLDPVKEVADTDIKKEKHKQIQGVIDYYKKHPEEKGAVEFIDWAAEHYGLNKALTAGFGGGSPMDFTGGSVLQTESLDSKLKSAHIKCDSCGKEQIHHPNQVKCRQCGKSFSLEKLFRAIKNLK